MNPHEKLIAFTGISGIILTLLGRKVPYKHTLIPINYKIGSKEKGYEIIDYKDLIIHNENVAYKYAFQLGIKKVSDNKVFYPTELLIGNSFDLGKYYTKKLFDTTRKVKFTFELFKYFYSGVSIANINNKNQALKRLDDVKNYFKSNGFDTSELIVELIKE